MDSAGNIHVPEWLVGGRFTKFQKVDLRDEGGFARVTTAERPEITGCDRCGRVLPNSAYALRAAGRRVPHCLRCALRFRPMLKRSLIVAAIVGTVVTGINQGDFIVSGDLYRAMAWKIPLTYTVPFIVATTGGLLNARSTLPGPDASRPPK
ncbi:MAG: nitrate/nitrite transporter NrtS [Chloroflexi bacterium]|nr:nitrate/nitrite transporter NrtS [Chloroflexota bacterium]